MNVIPSSQCHPRNNRKQSLLNNQQFTDWLNGYKKYRYKDLGYSHGKYYYNHVIDYYFYHSQRFYFSIIIIRVCGNEKANQI